MKERTDEARCYRETAYRPDCAQLNLQYANPQGISWMLSVPCVTGVTKLLSLHQLGCIGRLDSTVKSPHRNQRYLHLLWVWMTDSRGLFGGFVGFWIDRLCEPVYVRTGNRQENPPVWRATKQDGRSKKRKTNRQKHRNWRLWPRLHPCRCTVDPRLTSPVNIILLCITSHSSYRPMKTPGCQGLATVDSQWKTSVSVFCFFSCPAWKRKTRK